MTADIVPHGYYVYTHHRATTGEIFYVGMGYGKRAWNKAARSKYWKAIAAKYGRTVEIVESGLQHWAAIELEQNLIALYGRKDLKLGPLINFTDGGEGVPGAKVSKELVARRAAGTSATRIKMFSQGLLTLHNEKAVRMLTTGLTFTSTNAAVKWLRSNGFPKATHSSIGRTCKGTQAEAYGSGWEFADGSSPSKYVPKEGGAPKRWVMRDAGHLPFPSLSAATAWARKNGYPKASTGSICSACRGLQASAYGSTWRYFDSATPL